MAVSRVTPSGWLDESGSLSRVTPFGWVQESQSTGAVTHEASGTLSAGSGSVSGEAERTSSAVTHEASGTLTAGSAQVSGAAVHSVAGTGSISTPPIKNNTGTLLANVSGWTVNVYNVSTGAFVVQKTGLATDASGVLTITDSAIVAATTYSYEPVHATYGRRLPTAVAA